MEKTIVDREQEELSAATDEARREVFLRKVAMLVRTQKGRKESEKTKEK